MDGENVRGFWRGGEVSDGRRKEKKKLEIKENEDEDTRKKGAGVFRIRKIVRMSCGTVRVL